MFDKDLWKVERYFSNILDLIYEAEKDGPLRQNLGSFWRTFDKANSRPNFPWLIYKLKVEINEYVLSSNFLQNVAALRSFEIQTFCSKQTTVVSIVCLIQNVNMWTKQQIHNDVSIQLV